MLGIPAWSVFAFRPLLAFGWARALCLHRDLQRPETRLEVGAGRGVTIFCQQKANVSGIKIRVLHVVVAAAILIAVVTAGSTGDLSTAHTDTLTMTKCNTS